MFSGVAAVALAVSSVAAAILLIGVVGIVILVGKLIAHVVRKLRVGIANRDV